MQTIQIQQLIANQPTIFTAQDGRPLAAFIDYDLYLVLRETITAWYDTQADPATAELLRLHHARMAEIEQDPTQVVSDEELERDLRTKAAYMGH
jgi:hypothetical protein